MCTLATGVSFSMLTLAFAQLLYAISFKWTSVTGGSDGLAGIPRTVGPFGFAALSSKTGFYYLALACLVGGFLACRALVRSPFGAVLRGIRENEAKTTALGYNTRLYKIAVVAISYGLGGLAGALYAPFAGFANTELLFWLLSGQVLIMVIVGGAGTLVGPVLGAAFFMLMEHQLSALDRGVGALLRPDLHRFRPVRAPRGFGDWRRRGAGAPPPDALSVALLELDGVTRRYGALVALDQVAMAVEEGEVRAVIGPNGAGKTTLFNVITGTVGPTAGQIRFAGQAIAGLPSHQICRLGISRTFQITALFPEMSARENARLAAQARHPRRWQPFGGARIFKEAGRCCRCVRSSSSASAGIADRPAGLLSHGDQRLLEVAMAMAQQPRVLLLDEPTQGLLGRGNGPGGRHARAVPARPRG